LTKAYTIDAKSQFQYLTTSGEVKKIAATSEVHTAQISGKLASTSPISRTALTKRAVSYNGCTATQQSQISTAATSANSYVAAATSYLNGISSGTTRYTTWFGTFTAS